MRTPTAHHATFATSRQPAAGGRITTGTTVHCSCGWAVGHRSRLACEQGFDNHWLETVGIGRLYDATPI